MLSMQLAKNKVVIACAGSGKTTYLAKEALKLKQSRILVTTYTTENLDQVRAFLVKEAGFIPSNITIQSWFSFLLQEGVRPYQNFLTDKKRVVSVYFQEALNLYHHKNSYLTGANYIYSNKLSEFVYECNKKAEGRVLRRLETMYGYVLIDELQDFAGHDPNVLEEIFRSKISIIAVGDPRQATLTTNNSRKNSKYRRDNIHTWLKDKEKKKEIVIEEINNCHRSNQIICDFADGLFPEYPKTKSSNNTQTGHDGIFCITPSQVDLYVEMHEPKILRNDIRTDTQNLPAMNIRISKGRTYERVLIFPTEPIRKYLKTKDPSKAGDRTRLYVAVTRARHSVAFVLTDKKAKTRKHIPRRRNEPV